MRLGTKNLGKWFRVKSNLNFQTKKKSNWIVTSTGKDKTKDIRWIFAHAHTKAGLIGRQ